ncbi:uncharacterized protein LOC129581612 [Paramacrobiotus metropolitanus]|uniref:uncharacterized protein LOC129581612 n=1 Tax=Paramacrobiotus metropolitanus TaxID=2943436 RepID=UPI0024461941|nr:uncharacterized protein LOC129581612 [Paramacrobiotus metropolitanus]
MSHGLINDSKFLLKAQKILLNRNRYTGNGLDGRIIIWNEILAENSRQRTSSPVRAIAKAIQDTQGILPASSEQPVTSADQCHNQSQEAGSGSVRGLPWGVWLDGTPSEKLTMVQRHLQEEHEFMYPSHHKHFHPPMTEEQLQALRSAAETEQRKLPFATGSSLSDDECQKLEQVIAHQEVYARIESKRKDAFLKANMSQYSSANTLRKQMRYEEFKTHRLDQCRKKYEDFRWQHKKKVSSFRQEAINTIGKFCLSNPRSAGFPTSITFDVMEDFKAKLHQRQFKTDSALISYMKQINKLYNKETKFFRTIRRQSKQPQKHFIRTYSNKRSTPHGKKLVGQWSSRPTFARNSIGFALRGCPSLVRREMTQILKDRPVKRTNVDHLRTASYWHRQTGTIMCMQCGRQKKASVDRTVIPEFWIIFLIKIGQLCDGCPPLEVFSKSLRSREKPNKKHRGTALLFPRYEATLHRARRQREVKINKGKYQELASLQIGLKGTAVEIRGKRLQKKKGKNEESILDFDGYESVP